jgi:hypothetical protein
LATLVPEKSSEKESKKLEKNNKPRKRTMQMKSFDLLTQQRRTKNVVEIFFETKKILQKIKKILQKNI